MAFNAIIIFAIPLVFIVMTGLTIAPSASSLISQAVAPERNMLWPLVRLARILMFVSIFVASMHMVSNLRRHFGIVVFLAFATLSLVWSDDRMATTVSILNLLSLFSFSLVAVRYASMRHIVLCLWITSVIVASISFALAISGSSYALMEDGQWRGLFVHKNTFGPVCVVTLLVTLFARPLKVIPLVIRLAVSVLLLVCTVGSGSAGALVMLGGGVGVGLTVLFLDRVRRLKPHIVIPVAGLIVLGFVCVASMVPALVEALGRDLTFTGRTGLWQAVLPLTLQAPLGHGYGLSGGANALELVTQHARQVYAAIDSGYMVLALDLGWPAVALYVVGLLSLVLAPPHVREERIGLAVLSVLAAAQLIIAFTEKSGGPYPAFGTFVLMIFVVASRMERHDQVKSHEEIFKY